jgi:hypothetical protein
MEASEQNENVVVHHPNREKSSSKATKSIVIFLLIASAVLVLIVTAGGWASLQGAHMVSIAYIIVFVVMAYFVNKWNRGVLPLAAALAILLLVVAAIAGPAWFERDKEGFDNPGIPPGLLGLLTLLIVPVQILLIAFAMRGFSQKWNVEIEMPREEYEREHRGGGRPQYGGAAAG